MEDNIVIREVKVEDTSSIGQIPEKDCFTKEDFTVADLTKETSFEDAVKAKGFVERFLDYIRGNKFYLKCKQLGAYHKVPAKTIAKNFLEKVLGTISDVLGVVVDTIHDVFTAVVSLLSTVLTLGAGILCNAVKGLVSVITLNKTMIEQ